MPRRTELAIVLAVLAAAVLLLLPRAAAAGPALSPEPKGVIPVMPPRRVAMIIGSDLVPIEQFSLGFIDACPAFHWHAANGVSVTSFEGVVIPDPDVPACGFGIVGTLHPREVFDTALPDADFDGIPDSADPAPDNPDANNDGIVDSAEDVDGDGLTAGEEFWLSMTDPGLADSNMNGYTDGVDYAIASTERGFTVIPVIANLYTGSGATPQHVRDAIEQANIVLKQAKIRLVAMTVRENVSTGDDGAGGGTANDGRLTSPEGEQVRDAGLAEVAGATMRKGFKISFAANGGVLVGSTTPGLSWHREGSVLCTQRASTALTGSTIAHELVHVLTLDHPTAATPLENTPGNLMTPSNAGRDMFVNSADADKGIRNVVLTPNQRAQIVTDNIAAQLGQPSGRQSPAQKRQYAYGVAIDASGDATAGQPGYLDLRELRAASDDTRDRIQLLLSLNGAFPDTGPYFAVYRVLVNTDNASTGSTVAGIAGIDLEAEVAFRRDAAGATEVLARRIAYPAATRRAIHPFPRAFPITIRADDALEPDRVLESLVEIVLRKSDFPTTAAIVPIAVVAQAGNASPAVDTATMAYDTLRWQADPTLALAREFAAPGQSVAFTVAGLGPNLPFDVRVDAQSVLNGTLDAGGGFSGTLTIPVAQAADLAFVTAQDSSGAFAASGLVVADAVFANGFE